MKKILITFLASISLIGVLAVAGAVAADVTSSNPMQIDVNKNGDVVLRGTLVSAYTSTNSIVVGSWFGNFNVDVSQARLQRAVGGELSNLTEFQAGDMVTVHGTASSTAPAITAKLVDDNSLRIRKADVIGIISNLNTSTDMFTLTTSNNTAYQIAASSSTQITVNLNGGTTFADLTNGMRAQVWGEFNRAQTLINARAINAKAANYFSAGTITSIDATSTTFMMSTPKGTVDVSLLPGAQITVNGATSNFASLTTSMRVRVRGFNLYTTPTMIMAKTVDGFTK